MNVLDPMSKEFIPILLSGLNDGKYSLSYDEFKKGNLNNLFTEINKDFNINEDLLIIIICWLWENNYICFDKNRTYLTVKAQKELEDEFEVKIFLQ